MCIFLKRRSDNIGFGKDGKGAIIREDITFTIGTLAGKTGLFATGGGLSGTLGEDFRILKTEAHGLEIGAPALEESLELYLLNGELSLTEAQEAIEVDGPTDRNDRLNTEHVERWVRYVGEFQDITGLASSRLLIGDGNPITVLPRWTFSNPEGWEWMVYNPTGSNRVTGGVVSLKATHYGVWVT